ncbi:sterol-sensing domain of SREBP cleavage-activation-domain-containing protein [Plectosphaerella cucumerina]|uniref:Sterol regulatory element-binding protein cleavage-activating protein n=1 Tax=Plectosphaerella cucumerina TaxID=40658 RepID=A0A8K0X4J9_9PEZI|nr:sterol-sensing domain of SREBP cleavage-activation-domain-containing protein [Plectosphaerella cucumerina]
MIWYLLYPLRGTSEAPVLDPSHPLRRAFARYGACVARHIVTTLLISSAVAAILIYPFPFLYTSDFTNGASNLPHHVWTLARPLDNTAVEPDVIMRSFWVHGSYMKALEREVLLGALELQDEILGSTLDFDPRRPRSQTLGDRPWTDMTPDDRDAFHVINGLTNQSWFFHSPLQYWSGSPERIVADQDIISTVNYRKNQPTSVNITLRHSIVFSGKHFEDRRLLAADALVVTLIHLRDSPVGQMWERKAQEVAAKMAGKWTAYPSDGKSQASQVYEFQFRPMSVQDTVTLALAYGLVAIYFLASMSKLKAVKSKFGLIVTVLSQIVLSIMSSFTVCAIFKVDLSRIPQAAYPVVVLSMSLENIFRLINAVIATPSEDSTGSRISHAFGDTAHIAFASSTQNVLILWALSKIVSPGVAAFCTFAAVAIVFDFFYLSTFFLSVLCVDVRRTELSDALDRAALRFKRRGSSTTPRQTWAEAILQGRIAMSTRVAGTTIMLTFVLIAQWHFFENETILRVFLNSFVRGTHDDPAKQKESLLVDIHQARSPTSWLKLQDHETAREVINVIKPEAHSYIARVYDPIVFVLNGADRTPHHHERLLLPAVYDFLDHHLTRFVVTVLFIVAAVRLLMNYLLWEEDTDGKSAYDSDDEPLISIRSLEGGHALDVAMMKASADGHIISVGLDRSLRLWEIKSRKQSCSLADVSRPPNDPFPIYSLAMDDDCNWLALLSPSKVQLWSLSERRWAYSFPIDLNGQRPQAFFFEPIATEGPPPLIVVRRSGVMTRILPAAAQSADMVICKSPLVSAEALLESNKSPWDLTAKSAESLADAASSPAGYRVLTVSRKGCIHVAAQKPDAWTSQSLDLHSADDRDAHQILPLPDLDCFLIARQQSVDLVDGKENTLLHTFKTGPIQPRTLRCFHSARRKPQCGSVGLITLGLAYTHAETGDCVIQTYSPRDEGDTICFRNSKLPVSRSCCEWADTNVSERRVKIPGTWEALPNGFVVGVRRIIPVTASQPDTPSTRIGLRRRIHSYSKSDGRHKHADNWEVWVAYHSGRQDIYETKLLHDDNGSHLMISDLGPMVQVGTASVVVGFGNILKLITVGHERFEKSRAADRSLEPWNVGSRRRKTGQSAARAKVNHWA